MSVDISPEALSVIDARLRGVALAGVECCAIAADMLEALAALLAEAQGLIYAARQERDAAEDQEKELAEELRTVRRNMAELEANMAVLTANKDAAHHWRRENLARAEAAEARVAELEAQPIGPSDQREKHDGLRARILAGKASQQEASDAIEKLCQDNERLAVSAGRQRARAEAAEAREAKLREALEKTRIVLAEHEPHPLPVLGAVLAALQEPKP